MAISKITLNGTTLMDVTTATAATGDVIAPKTAMLKNGVVTTGTGTAPAGTKSISITQNGTTTEDVAAYASAEITVNVQGGGEAEVAKLIERSATTIVNDEATSVGGSAFYSYTALTSVKLPNVKLLGVSAFQGCNGLTTVVFPTINGRINGSAFRQCINLEAADFYSPAVLDSQVFYNCSKFTKLILRGDSVCVLNNTGAFSGSPFWSNGTGGTLYVPSALISSYQAATNWSTILGYANNQILPIEGSIYESQYADGTPVT